MDKIIKLFLFNLRLLTFRMTRDEFASFSSSQLIFGLFSTWIVGVGRWWDEPGLKLIQHLGLGSVVYIFILSAIIWLLVMPLKPRMWSYKHVLTFVSLTSLPALLYAIPVEKFLSIDSAIGINIWFLAIVAVWRVSLFLFYLGRHAGLSWLYRVVVGLLPLSAIVFSLFVLNLHRVVFDIMGGLRHGSKSSHDGEYAILFLLTALSYFAIIPLIISYAAIVIHARKSKVSELSR